ncbi:MAG: hypothetical protein ACI38A_12010 [Candidatus Ornithomonoglobus sp.]
MLLEPFQANAMDVDVPAASFEDTSDTEKTSETAELRVYTQFDIHDYEITRSAYVFEIVGEFDTDNEHYYLGRWQWNVEGHNSLLCDFVLKESLTEMYDCTIEDNKIDWFESDSVIK